MAETFDRRSEKAGGDGKVEDGVAADPAGERIVGRRLREVPLHVVQALPDPGPYPLVDGIGVKFGRLVFREGLHRLGQGLPPALIAVGDVIQADDLQGGIQQSRAGKVVESGHHQPFGKIAARPEDHQRAGRRRPRADRRSRACTHVRLTHSSISWWLTA